MRKLLLIAAFFLASPGFIFSQGFSNPPCIPLPNSNTEGYYFPFFDSLPCVERGLPFTSVIEISMPVVFNSGVLLDSLVLDSVTGFPPGITYQQIPASGIYYGDSSGCIAVIGTTTTDTGSYELTFHGYAVVTTESSGTQTFSLTQLAAIQDAPVAVYFLNVIEPGDSCFPPPIIYGATGVHDLIQSAQLNVFPNPSNDIFNLQLNVSNALSGQILVTDISGRTVYTRPFSTAGYYQNVINLSDCAKGLYLLQLRTSEGVISKRISLQ